MIPLTVYEILTRDKADYKWQEAGAGTDYKGTEENFNMMVLFYIMTVMVFT